MKPVTLFACSPLLLAGLCNYAIAETGTAIEEVRVFATHDTRTIDLAESIAIAADTSQLLKRAPGANVNGNGPLSGVAQLRGMFGPRVGLRVDGAMIAPAGPNWMDPPLSYAAAAQLDTLELYRGIAPVSVVPESIGGAIVAASWNNAFGDGEAPEWNARIVATGQSVNEGTMLSAALYTANDRHRLRLGAMTESADDAGFPDGDVLPTEYQRDRFDVDYGMRSGAHQLEVNYTRNETGEAGTPALPMDIEYFDGDLLNMAYRYVTGGLGLELRIFGSELEHGMSNYHLRRAPMSDSMWRRNIATADNRGLKLATTFEDDAGRWVLGVDAFEEVHDSDIDNPNMPMFFVVNFNDARRDLYGLFVERQHDFANGWRAELGLRYNRVEMDADAVDGSPAQMMPPAQQLRDAFNAADRAQSDDNIDVVAKTWYRYSDRLSWYAGVSRKTRSPAFQERYLWLPLQATGGLADGLTYTGNIELDPEVAHDVEAGLDFSGARFAASPRVFYRKVDDYIQGTPSEIVPARMFVQMMSGTNRPAPLQFNNVEALLWGADVDWHYQLDAEWSLNGILNYVRGERDDIDDNLYRIAPMNGSVALNYSSANWGATLEAVLYDDQDKVSATNGESDTPSYELVNLRGFWQLSGEFRLAGGIDNLFDESYQDHLGGYNRAANPDVGIAERLPGWGRNFFLRLDYKL